MQTAFNPLVHVTSSPRETTKIPSDGLFPLVTFLVVLATLAGVLLAAYTTH